MSDLNLGGGTNVVRLGHEQSKICSLGEGGGWGHCKHPQWGPGAWFQTVKKLVL